MENLSLMSDQELIQIYRKLVVTSRSAYKAAYMGAKRKQLVEKFNYDCKNAAHGIRLLRMGCEFLASGNLLVDRTGWDADELLAIKRGEWTIEQVQKESARLLDNLRAREKSGNLPNGLSSEVVQAITYEFILRAHNYQLGGRASLSERRDVEEWGVSNPFTLIALDHSECVVKYDGVIMIEDTRPLLTVHFYDGKKYYVERVMGVHETKAQDA